MTPRFLLKKQAGELDGSLHHPTNSISDTASSDREWWAALVLVMDGNHLIVMEGVLQPQLAISPPLLSERARERPVEVQVTLDWVEVMLGQTVQSEDPGERLRKVSEPLRFYGSDHGLLRGQNTHTVSPYHTKSITRPIPSPKAAFGVMNPALPRYKYRPA